MALGWDAAQYLKFGRERGQASRDLAQRVAARLPQARDIIDLGCGPGNSTAMLARQWPRAASITGLDASEAMLATARSSLPRAKFIAEDIPRWAESETRRYDLVFSNSALQWVPDLDRVVPQLLTHVAGGGALAFQIPASHSAAACELPRRLAASPAWRDQLRAELPAWHTETLDFFYDRLAPAAGGVELWETEYVHIMADAAAILEWYKGSGLRPILQALAGEAERERFMAEYLEGLRAAYPAQPDGRVLFPFRRRFVIAWAR